jgi:hypothetical protein
MPKTTSDNRPELRPVNVGAAAIDIGSKMHMAAVNPAYADTGATGRQRLGQRRDGELLLIAEDRANRP